MLDVVLGVLVLAACALLAVVIWLARQGRVGATWLVVLAVLCSAGLLTMLVSDWPGEFLARFWADHTVLTGVLTSVLLVGIGFLLFEVWDVHEQDRLDRTLTAAGMGGLVDHAVDVEVALSVLVGERSPDRLGWPGWRDGRPLGWLRERRELLFRAADGGPRPEDPRGRAAALADGVESEPWRVELADQSVRRLLAAIRDWTPVLARSRSGLHVLIELGELRNQLMRVESLLERGSWSEVTRLVESLRTRCRVMAHALESASLETARASGLVVPHRLEVLQRLAPLDFGADLPLNRGWLADDWSRRQRASLRELRSG